MKGKLKKIIDKLNRIDENPSRKLNVMNVIDEWETDDFPLNGEIVSCAKWII